MFGCKDKALEGETRMGWTGAEAGSWVKGRARSRGRAAGPGRSSSAVMTARTKRFAHIWSPRTCRRRSPRSLSRSASRSTRSTVHCAKVEMGRRGGMERKGGSARACVFQRALVRVRAGVRTIGLTTCSNRNTQHARTQNSAMPCLCRPVRMRIPFSIFYVHNGRDKWIVHISNVPSSNCRTLGSS